MSNQFEKIISALDHVSRKDASKATARCPSHDDKTNSLSISCGADGKVLVNCFAGCETHHVMSALGMTMADLFEPTPQSAYPLQKKLGKVETVPLASGCSLSQYASHKQLPETFLSEIGVSNSSYSSHPALHIEYRDVDGHPGVSRYRIALENDATTKARFLWKKGSTPCPYGLWLLSQAKAASYVVMVEGESDAHTLWYHNIPAIGIPGASIWKAEWANYFEDIETIYLVVEPDQGGQEFMKRIIKSVLRPRIRLLYMKEFKDPSSMYLSQPDSFCGNWDALLASAMECPEQDNKTADIRGTEAQAEPKKSSAKRLIGIASEAELFHSDRDEAFARITVGGHLETWPIRSKAFRKWLSFKFYMETDRPPNAQAMEEALSTLEAKCYFAGRKYSLSLRMAKYEDALWLDLTDDEWQAVEITKDRWTIKLPPPLFRRYPVGTAQVMPQSGGDLSLLRQFVNVRDEKLYKQLLVWLVACFFPEIAHPVLSSHAKESWYFLPT